MMRTIGSVIAGYATMFIVVFVGLMVAYMVLGTDGAFKVGSFEPSLTWLVIMFVVGFVAAVGGGFVCRAIAKSNGAVKALVGVVLVLGLLSAIPAFMQSDEAPERTGDLAGMEAMGQARQPLWVALVNPIIGAAGALIGGRRSEDA